MKKFLFISCIFIFALSLAAQEEGNFGRKEFRKGPGMQPGILQWLKRMDANQDQELSKEEWMKGFAKLDKNKDGFVAPEEMQPGHEGKKEGPDGGMMDRFKKMDADQDGKISKEEWKGPEQMFAKLDRDGDGFIGKDELPQGMGQKPGQKPDIFKNMDADGDGKISKEEWKGPEQVFGRLDRNQDGFITKDELPQGMGQKPGKEQKQDGGKNQILERIKKMDSDGDGKISKEEWQGPEQMFARFDSNGDGFITPNEFAPKHDGTGKGREKEGMGNRKRPEHGNMMDTDRDGKVSKEEWAAHFQKLDKNGDGVITKDELPFPPKGEKGQRGEKGEKGDKGHFFKKMDLNQDGKISKDEWQGPPQAFEKLDQNSDGFITVEELRAFGKGQKGKNFDKGFEKPMEEQEE